MKKFNSYEAFLDDLEEKTGYQVFDQRTDANGVKTPYIVAQRISNDDILADNQCLLKRDQIALNLHAYQKNRDSNGEKVKAEKKIEDYLMSVGSIFDRDDDWLDNIQLYVITYGFEVMYE